MVHYVDLMNSQLGSPPSLNNALLLTEETQVDIHVFHKNTSWSTAAFVIDRDKLFEVKTDNPNSGDSNYTLHRAHDKLILETSDGEYDIYFQINTLNNSGGGIEYSASILVLILAVLLLMYFATRSLFRPIDDIRRGVQLFGEGDFDHKISKRRNDELGELTDSINQMAQDINQMLEAKRQFLLGISHELRSPLTRCKVNLALLDDGSTKAQINREIAAMDSLIGELLESERLNSPHYAIQPEPTELEHLISELIDSEFAEQPLDVDLESITASVDGARIRLLLRNLIQNALKYTNPSVGKLPILSLLSHGDAYEITMEDFGEGVAREHIPFLTEPFYRADPSRRRITGGYGLGLYLCRMIMKAHNGNISINSTPGQGTKITCRFPL